MKASILATYLIFLCVTVSLSSDYESPQVPRVIASSRGDVFFKMMPPKRQRDEDGKMVTVREPFGVAYKVGEDGEFEELWRTSGWYSFESFLSDDGEYLVRMGPKASEEEDHTDLALAIYRSGELIKEYQVKDLVKNFDADEYSRSLNQWRPAVQSKPTRFLKYFRPLNPEVGIDILFYLVVADKTTYTFALRTGEIVKTGVDKDAKTFGDLAEEKAAPFRQRGLQLYEESAFKPLFDSHFSVNHVSAIEGYIVGVRSNDPQWCAEFTPKKDFAHRCAVDAVFPIREGKRLEANVTPDEILSALEKCFAHPFIVERFKKDDAFGIRMQITGDRLHWNTSELKELMSTLKMNASSDADLREWAWFTIVANEPLDTSFYFHKETGQIIIYDDSTEEDQKPILLDSTGKQRK